MPCNRCKTTSSDPFNFLLSCSACGKKWHHRCHIPPLTDLELIALIRATNDNDVDNGLDSWTGRCCKRQRTRAPPISEALSRSAPTSAVEIKHDRQSYPVPPIETPADVFPIHNAPQQKTRPLPVNSVATTPKPDDGLTAGDFRLSEPEGWVEPQTTPVQSVAQHPSARPNTSPPMQNMTAKDDQLLRSTPRPSTSSRSTPPSFGGERSPFVPYSRPAHLREGSMALTQTATDQQSRVEPTHAHPTSQLRTPLEGTTSHAPKESSSTSINPQMLDLRALLLSRASGPSKAPQRLLISRPATSAASTSTPPVPPVASIVPEDDEMEDLYGPPLGLPSPYAPPPPLTPPPPPHEPPRKSPFPQLPAESEEPPLLPVLAARDPRILAMLERQERREAARPRRGKCKVQAVRGAGKKRGGFVLVANWTVAGAAHAEQASLQTSTRR